MPSKECHECEDSSDFICPDCDEGVCEDCLKDNHGACPNCDYVFTKRDFE